MIASLPHYVLHTQTTPDGQWAFDLRREGASSQVHAQACEPGISGDRLALLAVVRGLEALDEPARVTVCTASRYVVRALNRALDDWRRTGFRWQSYGRMVPIKNRDLWQRLDRALKFHTLVQCQWRGPARTAWADKHLRVDPAEASLAGSRRRPAVARRPRTDLDLPALARPASCPAEPAAGQSMLRRACRRLNRWLSGSLGSRRQPATA